MPYLFRASFSHFARFALLLFFLHAFSALASFCARVNGLGVVGLVVVGANVFATGGPKALTGAAGVVNV